MALRIPCALMRGLPGLLLRACVLLLLGRPSAEGWAHPALKARPGGTALSLVAFSAPARETGEAASHRDSRQKPEGAGAGPGAPQRDSRQKPEGAGAGPGAHRRRPQHSAGARQAVPKPGAGERRLSCSRPAPWHWGTSGPRPLLRLFSRREAPRVAGQAPLVGRRRLSSADPSGSKGADGAPHPPLAAHDAGGADASGSAEGEAEEPLSPEPEAATASTIKYQPPLLLKWRTPEGAMVWPDFLFGNTVRGPWQRPYTSSSFHVASSCALVRPSPSSRVPVWPITTGKAMSRNEWLQELNRTRGGRSARLRAVLWLPFNGLGNVLRAAPVAMAYALISGRRLLRCTSGPNHQVMKSICDAFDCGLDSLADIGDPTPISKRIEGLGVLRWAKSAADTRMFFLWDRTFEQWDSDPKVRRCVMDSFECMDMWCVNSKALQLLLLEPTGKLNHVIEEYFTLAPQEWRLSAPSLPPAGLPLPFRIQGRSLLTRGPQQQHAEQNQLGQPSALRRELGDVSAAQQRAVAMPGQLQQQRPQQQLQQQQQQLLLLQQQQRQQQQQRLLQQGQQQRQLQQQQQLRPLQQQQQQPVLMGGMQQKRPNAEQQAQPQHGQQQQQGRSAASIKEGLYLEPDLGLHIRVVHRCVEVDPTAPHCRVSGLQESITRSKNERRLRSAIAAPVWACISTLLTHLHALKLLYLDDQAALGRGGAGAAGAPPPDPVPKITWTPKYRDAFSRLLTGSSPSNVSGLWSIERAHAFAGAHLPRARRVPLSIFLATDSEILRPLLVEFLRPFGTVIFSRALVAHTSTSSGATAEVEAVMGKARLAAVGEFFTLSKSSVIHIPTNYRLGTFSFKAAEYGNSTLVIRERFNCSNRCCFQVQHWGERQ